MTAARTRNPLDGLVRAAAGGDADAWSDLVGALMPVVTSIIDEFGLDRTDAADVNQTVWLRLVQWLRHLRDPSALSAWIATTTWRECNRVRRTGHDVQPFGLYPDAVPVHHGDASPVPEDVILRAERHQVLRDGFALLPDRCRTLLGLLMDDPPATYQQIVEQTGMAVGSVGPTQLRCLDKLRATPPVAAYLRSLRAKGGHRGTA